MLRASEDAYPTTDVLSHFHFLRILTLLSCHAVPFGPDAGQGGEVMSSAPSTSPEARFWDWFAQHSKDLLAIRTGHEPVLDTLMEELHRVREGLSFEFGPVLDGRREFIVSADGNKERFQAVKRLIALAPDLPGWLLIPFRPPKEMGRHILRFGDIELSGDDVWFSLEGAGRKVHLDLYIRGFSEETKEQLGGSAFVLLDGTLGEFVVETRIGAIGWHGLPDDPKAEGLRPFADLSSVVSLPVRYPVSLLDALEEGEGGPAPAPPEVPEGDSEQWALLEMTQGELSSLVGVREGLLDLPKEPALDHEVLVVVTFNDVQENGLPSSKEELT